MRLYFAEYFMCTLHQELPALRVIVEAVEIMDEFIQFLVLRLLQLLAMAVAKMVLGAVFAVCLASGKADGVDLVVEADLDHSADDISLLQPMNSFTASHDVTEAQTYSVGAGDEESEMEASEGLEVEGAVDASEGLEAEGAVEASEGVGAEGVVESSEGHCKYRLKTGECFQCKWAGSLYKYKGKNGKCYACKKGKKLYSYLGSDGKCYNCRKGSRLLNYISASGNCYKYSHKGKLYNCKKHGKHSKYYKYLCGSKCSSKPCKNDEEVEVTITIEDE